MNKIQCKKILQIKIKELQRALYKGEFGTMESEEETDRQHYCYISGYLEGLYKALHVLEVK